MPVYPLSLYVIGWAYILNCGVRFINYLAILKIFMEE